MILMSLLLEAEEQSSPTGFTLRRDTDRGCPVDSPRQKASLHSTLLARFGRLLLLGAHSCFDAYSQLGFPVPEHPALPCFLSSGLAFLHGQQSPAICLRISSSSRAAASSCFAHVWSEGE